MENETYYQYTGPADSRNESWCNQEAYESKKQKTPVGSIYIKHPELQMLCRVTEDSRLPGFIVTCKDNDGRNLEVHAYYNPHMDEFIVCTSRQTGEEILTDAKKQIHQRYKLPFSENTKVSDDPADIAKADQELIMAKAEPMQARVERRRDTWNNRYFCPRCNTLVKQIGKVTLPNYCPECGQRLKDDEKRRQS